MAVSVFPVYTMSFFRWSPGHAAMLLMVAVASGVSGAAVRNLRRLPSTSRSLFLRMFLSSRAVTHLAVTPDSRENFPAKSAASCLHVRRVPQPSSASLILLRFIVALAAALETPWNHHPSASTRIQLDSFQFLHPPAHSLPDYRVHRHGGRAVFLLGTGLGFAHRGHVARVSGAHAALLQRTPSLCVPALYSRFL
jgi:hypothetical protein